MAQNESYKTLSSLGEGRLTDRKSEFIAYARPIKSEEEALSFVDEIRAKHRDARHCVYAYYMRGGAHKRCSDDGEPSGSAGKPVLDLLEKNLIEDSVIAVVRYFGGILLGTGGLVRAYSGAAAAAVENAGIRTLSLRVFLEFRASYNDWSRLERALTSAGATVEKTEFGADVGVSVSVSAGAEDGIIRTVSELSAGRCEASVSGSSYA